MALRRPADASLRPAAICTPTLPGSPEFRASRRPRHRAPACVASIGSSFSSPMCRPASARSSPSISPDRNGRRSISAWCSPQPAWSHWWGRCRAGPWSISPAPSGWWRASRSQRSASARSPMRPGRFCRWCCRPRCCTRAPAACSAPPSRRSASAWSAMRPPASGSAAMRASRPSATGWRQPPWAPAAISSRRAPCSSSRRFCSPRPC